MAKKNLFNSVKMYKPKRNRFDLTHDVKMSLNMGNLVPICALDTVPGDSFNIGCEALIRLAPMVAPVMHRVNVFMHYFFVPNRILWPGWEDYITGENTSDAPPFFVFNSGEYALSELHDYMGLPALAPGGNHNVNALPYAAYQKIYNDYYRDQNLIADLEQDIVLVDGSNAAQLPFLRVLRKRAWEHDYYTSALPFAQKGDAVDIPLGGFNDVQVYRSGAGAVTGITNTLALNTPLHSAVSENPSITGDSLYADTSDLQFTSTTINDLRTAFRVQEWLEKNARGGTRYAESNRVHFGVTSSDARLNRPEYITGARCPIVISEVLNTSGTFDATDPEDATSPPQGNMAGHGIAVADGAYGNYYCEEHGWIIGIMSIMPKTAYQQGIEKKFQRFDKFEYLWPEFAHLGEQPILNKEVFVEHSDPDEPFGYIPRYAEYRFINNRVAGDFKDSLDYWHMGRIFATEPDLNQAFIEADPTTRIFAVTDISEHHVYAQVVNKIQAIRPLPMFGTPSF